ncbi:MAG TPA: DUF6457 domain-containing protein [Solirubrobacteraceae bacterium]
MTRDQWIAAFAAQIGERPPSVQEIRELLDLAGLAAHGSERTAAPLACWIAGRSEMPLADLLEAARRVGDPPGSTEGPGT